MTCFKRHEPQVNVGILSAHEILFRLNAEYSVDGLTAQGAQRAAFAEGGVAWKGKIRSCLTFTPRSEGATFALHDVTVGKGFHWQHQETQTFAGTLKLIVEGEMITAVNELPAERYIESVIGSEMNADAPVEFLKASAVVCRSWLFAQMENRKTKRPAHNPRSLIKTNGELIRWYDKDDHERYDICADDHCQRYQGIADSLSPNVKRAVETTRGQALMFNSRPIDARFSKCCGGCTEEFRTCWDNKTIPYLTPRPDLMELSNLLMPDLTREDAARKWVMCSPKALCNTHDFSVLKQILTPKDLETADFFRWKVEYGQEELAAIVSDKLKTDFGRLIDLVPVERGRGGRLSRLKIIGTKTSLIIGKELEIRRALSVNHLKSSAFVVNKLDFSGQMPQKFVLHGAGWGHGVGMCQIGAAMAGAAGYSCEEILKHYYKGATVCRIYQ